MAEKNKREDIGYPESGVVDSVESLINYVRDNGYLIKDNLEDLDNYPTIDKRLREEGLETNGDLIYDPRKFEVQIVETSKGLDPKYKADGWEEVGNRSAGGRIATLIKPKN